MCGCKKQKRGDLIITVEPTPIPVEEINTNTTETNGEGTTGEDE